MAERSEAVEEQAVRDGSAGYLAETEIATAEDVPPGYKRTEVGVIPEDWGLIRLGDLGTFSKGQGIKRDQAMSGAIPCIRYGEIYTHHNDVVRKYASRISREVANTSKPLKYGDLLFAGSGETKEEIGKTVAFVGTAEAYAGGDIVILRPHEGVPEFLGYLLNAPLITRQKASKGQGDAVVHISASALSSIALPYPTKKEQRAIATGLSDADALIESLDRLIAKKRAIKQAAMQQLLTGQTRLPGFTDEWETKRLGDVAEIDPENLGSSTPPTFTFNYISLEQVEQGKLLGWSVEKFASAPSRARRVLRGRDVLVSTVRPNLQSHYFFDDALPNPVCSTGFAVIRCDERSVNSRYVYAHFFGTDVTRQIDKIIAGSNYPAISSGDVRRLTLPFPSLEEQTAIATALSDMDTEIEALERRRDKARQIKQSMMQQLLTGRVRLVNSIDQKLSNPKPRSGQRKANVHFMRSVFAAEIVDQLHQEPTFGHVKLQKVLFLAEHLCDVDTGSTYHRKAAGPYDNRALRSIDSQMHRQRWFEARKEGGRYRYIPLDKRGYHKEYFDRYFCHVRELFAHVVEIFRKLDTERCEIVATLYSAWDDLLREQAAVSDEMIIHEVLNNWHESKNRIPKDRWAKALSWMREMGFVPKRRLANE